MRNIYLIKDLSQVTGVSVDSIKYYCKLGLVKEEGRSFGTNFRYFGEAAVEDLRSIRQWRRGGHSLKDIRRMLPVRSPS